MRKKVFPIFSIAAIILVFVLNSASAYIAKIGNHYGEVGDLQYSIE